MTLPTTECGSRPRLPARLKWAFRDRCCRALYIVHDKRFGPTLRAEQPARDFISRVIGTARGDPASVTGWGRTLSDRHVIIKRLGVGDIPLLRQLNGLFGRAFDDPDAYGSKPPSAAYLKDLLAKEHVVVLAAMTGEDVVGGLVAYELDKFEQARREIYIYDLAVDVRHRRRGVATALIDRLHELAAGRGAWVVYVQADRGDDPAIALYQKLGTREEVLHFDIAVKPFVERSLECQQSGDPDPE